MNSRLLGRNGRLLMPILAILLMNVRVAEARLDWPEGTKGNIAMAGWFITSIAFGVGMAGAIMHAYRTVIGRRAIPSDVELCNQIRKSGEWLAYTAWIRAECTTAHPLERAALARIIDLERQLFGEPSPPRPLLSRLFSCLFTGAKNGSTTTPTSGDKLATEKRRLDKGKAPERPHISQTQILTDERAKSATTKHDGNFAAHGSTSSTKSVGPSKILAIDQTDSSIIKDDGKIATHGFVSLTKSPSPSRKSDAQGTKSAFTKDGGENATHDSVSFAKSALPSRKPTAHMPKSTASDKTRRRAKQNVITPLPKARVATSSKHNENPFGQVASHGSIASPSA